MIARMLLTAGFTLAPAAALAQAAPAPVAPLPMTAFDGLWRGPATLTLPSGARSIIQTERVGPALGGALRVIEGHAYTPDGGEAGFDALGVVSAAQGGGFEFRAYAQGRSITVPITITANSFDWSLPVGQGGAVHYTATVTGAKWHEEGWYEQGGQKLAKVLDMTLDRVGPTDWPAEKAVPPK